MHPDPSLSPAAREAVLARLVGRRYAPRGRGPDVFDCWGLVVYASLALWRRPMPDRDVDPGNTLQVARAFASRPARAGWRVWPAAQAYFDAPDGAVLMLARGDMPFHVGLWLAPERRVLHCCDAQNVVLDTLPHLAAAYWRIKEILVPA